MAESSRHLDLKKEIARFFKEKGWSTSLEAPGPGWRADCLVEKEGRKAAIEIEFSRPSLAQIKKRTLAYEKSGVKSLWFISEKNQFQKMSDLPVFPISSDNQVRLDCSRTIDLENFLLAIEEKRIYRRSPLLDSSKAGALILFQSTCYNCKKHFSAWQGLETSICICGKTIDYPGEMKDYLFERELRKIYDPVYSPFGPPAFYKKRGTSIRPKPYYAAHCPHCLWVQGNWFLQTDALSALGYDEGEVVYISEEASPKKRSRPSGPKHWCLI